MATTSPNLHAGIPGVQPRELAMIVHDLRGALQGVLGGVGMLEMTAAGPDARTQIDRVAASAQTLACLVNGLIGEEITPEHRERHASVDVPRFLRHLGKRWSGEAEERGLGFRIEADAGLPGVLRVDLVSLARALGNLIGNAFAHGGPGVVRLVARRASDGGASFEVLDNGPGLTRAVLDAMTQPGPADPGPGPDGHGLGLHIARDLSEQIGAAFSLANRAQGGVAAEITVPGSLCSHGPAPSEAEPLDVERGDLAGVRILLAEDNPTNQIVAMQMLRALNAEVTLASDGIEALERFEAQPFDMVVVDIEMPRLSGLDVIRAIRARPDDRAGAPIVALTAYVMREHRERIASAGANGLVSKPIISVDALGAALRAHLPAASAQTAPPAAPESDESAVADLAIFDALCAAIGEGMMSELLEKVIADLMQARADMAGALAPLDRKPIRSASHILISVAGAIGATRLQGCARALNIAAHGEQGDDLSADVLRCIVEIDAAVAFADGRRSAAG